MANELVPDFEDGIPVEDGVEPENAEIAHTVSAEEIEEFYEDDGEEE